MSEARHHAGSYQNRRLFYVASTSSFSLTIISVSILRFCFHIFATELSDPLLNIIAVDEKFYFRKIFAVRKSGFSQKFLRSYLYLAKILLRVLRHTAKNPKRGLVAPSISSSVKRSRSIEIANASRTRRSSKGIFFSIKFVKIQRTVNGSAKIVVRLKKFQSQAVQNPHLLPHQSRPLDTLPKPFPHFPAAQIALFQV